MQASVIDVPLAVDWIRRTADSVAARREHLTQLDRAIGDGDHGANLDRGFTAVIAALDAEPPQTAGGVLVLAGRSLVSMVGGASGPLYGMALRAMGRSLDAGSADAQGISAALSEAFAAIGQLGKAEPGEKTMVDAFGPAVAAFDDAVRAHRSLADAATDAARAAARGADATTAMVARKGRASQLGERSVGHQDPGATSTALLFHALAETVREPAREA